VRKNVLEISVLRVYKHVCNRTHTEAERERKREREKFEQSSTTNGIRSDLHLLKICAAVKAAHYHFNLHTHIHDKAAQLIRRVLVCETICMQNAHTHTHHTHTHTHTHSPNNEQVHKN